MNWPTPKLMAGCNPALFSTSNSLRVTAAEAARSGKGVTLQFDQSSCADCTEMHERNLTDPTTARLLDTYFVVVRVNLGTSDAIEHFDGRRVSPNELAKLFNIRYTPTLVFMDAGGREFLRHDSYLEPGHFQLLLQYATAKERNRFVSFQDWIRARNAGQIPKQAP
jgi:thioredoxin-related protein